MQPHFFHVRRPRRVPFYLAAASAILLWYLLRQAGSPPYVFAGLGLFMAAMLGLALNSAAAGMEIRDGRWTFFVGRQSWSVSLGEVGAVRVLGARHRPRGLSLRLRDGRTLSLPAVLTPDLRALEYALAWRGIPVET